MKNYISANGNLGDAVIALGVEPYLKKEPRLSGRVLFRGGCFEPHRDVLAALSQIPRNTPLAILPSTFGDHTAQLLAQFRDAIVFCREPETFAIAKRWKLRAELAHDLAFNVDYSKWEGTAGSDVLECFRGDVESTTSHRPYLNRDLSAEQEGEWTPENCQEAAVHFISEIARYKEVQTDRLHVAIVAGLLGKRVKFYSGLGFKNRAVFAHSLAKLPNVTFHESGELVAGLPFRAMVIHQAVRSDRKEAVKALFRDVGNCGVFEAICPPWDSPANRAVRGCSLSHLELVRVHLSAPLDWLLVLEDDAVTLPAFREEFLQLRADEIPGDCAAVVVGGDCSNVSLTGGKFMRILPPFWGSHGVLYNLSLIRRTSWLNQALLLAAFHQLGPDGGSAGICYESLLMMASNAVGAHCYRMKSMAFTTTGGFSARSQTHEPPRAEALTV